RVELAGARAGHLRPLQLAQPLPRNAKCPLRAGKRWVEVRRQMEPVQGTLQVAVLQADLSEIVMGEDTIVRALEGLLEVLRRGIQVAALVRSHAGARAAFRL